jgi:hypothetical protein
MVVVVFPAVVLPEENLYMMPRALDGIGVGPGVRIYEVDTVVDGLMRVTLRPEIAVRTPAITYDRSAGFDPVTFNGHKCVGGSVLNGDKKCFPRLSFDTAKHPLTLNRVSPMILSPTELALVNFDGLLRTTNLNRAALQINEHGFSTEHAPVSDCMVTEGIFVYDLAGRFAALDVVGKK